jgi:hypothetical protein
MYVVIFLDGAIWNGHSSRLQSAAMNETNATMLCPVCANPAPSKYSWTDSDGNTLRPGISGTDSAAITISRVQDEDFTNYTCTVENVIESSTKRKEFKYIQLIGKGMYIT